MCAFTVGGIVAISIVGSLGAFWGDFVVDCAVILAVVASVVVA